MLSDIRKARPGGNHALVAALRTGQRTATWWGSGFDALGLDADPGAAITADQMAAVFGRLRYPDRGTNIGTAPRTYRHALDPPPAAGEHPSEADARHPDRDRGADVPPAGRTTTRSTRPMAAVAYYSFSFAPVKSVSVLYTAWLAAGRDDDAARLRACHDQAVAVALGWGEPHLAVSRTHGGRGVARFAPGYGLACALTPTLLSSAGDPHLNTLVMLLNRVGLPGGRIGALWGRSIGLTARGLSVAYDRALEQLATETLGLGWTTHTPRHREITGVPASLLAAASRRARAINDQHRDLLEQYQADHHESAGEVVAARLERSASRRTIPTDRRAATTSPVGPVGPAAPAVPAVPAEELATAVPGGALAELRPWIEGHRDELAGAADAVAAAPTPPAVPVLAPGELEDLVRAALAGPTAPRSGVVSARSGRKALGALMAAAAPVVDPATRLGVPAPRWPAALEDVVRRVAPVQIEEPPLTR